MNSHTAKLINRFASRTNQKPRLLKREWKALPRTERAVRRAEMKASVEQRREQS